ncbi:MAG: hypothetical protein MUF15_01680, partial [Acidobacteria bacterium]|nr:hypothetical protein [Acidobacteriota bacterium]
MPKNENLFKLPENRYNLQLFYKLLSQPLKGLLLCQAFPEERLRIIEFFKGTQAQGFFERMKNHDIKVSYKPQQVDLIPKSASGKVIDLLKKVDEKKEFDKI